jgi:excisionase family DNA binding protein
MTDLLTTKELQAILNVDRTTIYRMAESGRVPAVKVGGQWRFPRQQIESWLRQSAAVPAQPAQVAPVAALDARPVEIFPLECVQLIQDSFADALGVMIVATDLEGQAVTRASNACGLYTAAESSPAGRQRCLELWARIGNDPSIAPRFIESHLGLLCARGLIRVGNELRAMLVVGGIAPQGWPPDEEQMARIAADLDLPADVLRRHIDQVHHLDAHDQARVLPFVQRIADIFAHIAQERVDLAGRLQRIAEISRI